MKINLSNNSVNKTDTKVICLTNNILVSHFCQIFICFYGIPFLLTYFQGEIEALGGRTSQLRVLSLLGKREKQS
jgi:hypothetical protein